MDFNKAQQSVLHWLENFVEQPNPQLNGWAPCPYARAARLAQRVMILPGQHAQQDMQQANLDHHDVVAFLYDPDVISAQVLHDAVLQTNRDDLVPRNRFALADHPDSVEQVQGVCFNHGSVAMILVQHLDKLQDHARILARKGYYQGWPQDYLDDLFLGREDPRQ